MILPGFPPTYLGKHVCYFSLLMYSSYQLWELFEHVDNYEKSCSFKVASLSIFIAWGGGGCIKDDREGLGNFVGIES